MSQIQCLRIRLRPGTTEAVLEFFRTLAQRGSEVQEALWSEGIHAEALFLERGEDGDHLLFLTEAEDIEAAAAAFEASELPLDLEAKELIAEAWDEITPLEPILLLRRNEDRPA